MEVNMAMQQQVQDLIYYSDTQRQQLVLPRVESVRCHNTYKSGSDGISAELTFLPPQDVDVRERKRFIVVAIRMSSQFPSQPPMIACIDGGECLPSHLLSNRQLFIPWLPNGWHEGYTLSLFARDFCASLSNEILVRSAVSLQDTAVVHPLLLPPDSTYQCVVPSAPLYSTEDYVREDSCIPEPATCHQKTPDAQYRKLLIKCKWRDTTKKFAINSPITLKTLRQLLIEYFPGLSVVPFCLAEFSSSNKGASLTNEQQWQSLQTSTVSAILILVTETATPRPLVVNTDLIGLAQLPPSPPVWAVPKLPAQPSGPRLALDLLAQHTQVRQVTWTDIRIEELVGNGSSCRVYKGNWRGTDVAVKVFTGIHPPAVEKEFVNEVGTMARLGSHPSLVLLLAVTTCPLAIVFEYLPFSLFEVINGVEDPMRNVPPFTTSWTKRVTMMLDLAKGLQFLHSFNVIHRDLKSLNLLVTSEGRVKIADFGISRVAQPTSDMMTGCCGTFQWMAPEVIESSHYSVSADIYSFGIVMWEICEAAAPFADLAPALVPVAVLRDKKRPPLSAKTPQRNYHDKIAANDGSHASLTLTQSWLTITAATGSHCKTLFALAGTKMQANAPTQPKSWPRSRAFSRREPMKS